MLGLKKVLAALLAAVLFTGCSNYDREYLEMTKDALLMDTASLTGNFALEIDVPDEIGGYNYFGYGGLLGRGYEDVFSRLSHISIQYSIDYAKSKGLAEGKFTNLETGEVMLSFSLKDKKLWADVSYIVNEISKNLSDNYEDMNSVKDAVRKEALLNNDIKYISVDMEDLEQFFGDENTMSKMMAEDILTLNSLRLSTETQKAFIDNVLLGAFGNFNSGLVTYEDEAYTIRLDTEKTLQLMEKALLYLVDNSEKAAEAMGRVIDVYPLNYYDEDDQARYRADAKEAISGYAHEAKLNKDEYKEKIKDALNKDNVGAAAIMALLQGSFLEVSLKAENGGLTALNDTTIKIKAGMFSPKAVAFNIKGNSHIKQAGDISPNIPDEKHVKRISSLLEDMEYPKAMVVLPYNDYYTPMPEEISGAGAKGLTPLSAGISAHTAFKSDYGQSFIFENEKGTYIGGGIIEDFFGERFGYGGESYITASGVTRRVRFLTFEDENFVNINDLTELGYTVNIDFENNATIIIKRR